MNEAILLQDIRARLSDHRCEHSLQVAMIAHAIAVIARDRYRKQVDPEHVLSLAVYHDATEVMTGDLPTPVKYHNDERLNEQRKFRPSGPR